MSFINPYLLWGSVAVAIPILIHFWHQKRGKVIEWAATQWLVEKNQQQQRGLKFDNLLLLLLRALIVILLAVMLSQPILNGSVKGEAIQQIHLVQPDALLVNNFRFELEEALKKGEPVYWANVETAPVTALTLPQRSERFTVLTLQSAINKLQKQKGQLHLYVLNTQQLADVPFIYVPTRFRLHTLVDSVSGQRRFLALNQTKLFVNASGQLTNGAALPQAVRYTTAPANEGALAVSLNFRNKVEQQTVQAALDALNDVYKLNLSTDAQVVPNKRYDVVFTDQSPAMPASKTLYIVSGADQPSMAANIVHVSGSFNPQTSDIVAGGQLPEWLGERLVSYFGLNTTRLPLSQQQLNALFVPAKQTGNKHTDADDSAPIHGGLLLVFVILIGVERWLALTKNA